MNNKAKSKIWRKNFAISRVDYQMMHPIVSGFYWSQEHLGAFPVREAIFVFANNDNPGSYLVSRQLRDMIQQTLDKIITKPAWADKIHRETIKINKNYFAFAKNLRRLKLSTLSNKDIAKLHRQILDHQMMGHRHSLLTTWFVDSDGEDLTNYLLSYLRQKISDQKSDLNFAEVFSLLTTPLRESLARQEEKEALLLLKKILADKQAKKVFRQKDTAKIVKKLANISPALQRAIVALHKKWLWLPYGYQGPTYDLDYYLEVLSGLVRQKVRPDKMLGGFAGTIDRTRRAQQKLYRQLKIDRHYQQIFTAAQDIVFIKGFRKDCLYHGMYVLNLLLAEAAKRLDLSLMQVRYMTADELQQALEKNKIVSPKILDQRKKHSLLWMKDGQTKILVGAAAKKFLAKQKFEKIKIAGISELNGTCACPGQATGLVKIVNFPEEMSKMNKGDIMVAHTTFPALVPAMKKAKAIITEDGGITCHAAIVSRELKTPCLVGVKLATKILSDGDRVEVDATAV